jgi:DNA-binding NtrC family response regulator
MVDRARKIQSDATEPRGEVLLVVGDDALRAQLAELLQEGGHTVLAVSSLSEARHRLSRATPATLLIDAPNEALELRMLLDELADRDEAPPTVLCTDIEELDEVANDYDIERLEKPFGRYGFLAALARAREHRRRPSQRRQRIARPI